jgi:hypothetical protein
MPEHTFVGALNALDNYSAIQLSEEIATLELALFLKVKSSPIEHLNYATLLMDFCEIQEQIQTLVSAEQAKNWSKRSGKDLWFCIQAYYKIKHGIEHFLPEETERQLHSVTKEIQPQKEELYVWHLLLWGYAEEPEHQYVQAATCAYLFRLGYYAIGEFIARAQRNVGFIGALFADFCLSANIMKESEIVAVGAVDAIAKMAWGHIPKGSRPRADEDGFQDVKAQTIATLKDRFAGRDAREVIAEAVDGLHNILPRAVADDYYDKRKSKGKKGQAMLEEKTTLESEIPKFKLDEANEQSRHADPLSYQITLEELVAGDEMLSQFQDEYPKEHQLLSRSILWGVTHDKLAREYGVSPRTIDEMIAVAKTKFRDWYYKK